MAGNKLQGAGLALIALGVVTMALAGLGVFAATRTAALLAAIAFSTAGTICLILFVRQRRLESARPATPHPPAD